MPDVDRGALDRLARRDVEDPQAEGEERAGVALSDVAPDLLAGDVVRPLRELGRQDALHDARLDSLVAAFGRRREQCAAPGGGHECAAEPCEGAATCEPFGAHAATIRAPPVKEIGG